MSPAPIVLHQKILFQLSFLIGTFLKKTDNNGLVLFAPVDVKFDDGNIFQPDLIYISESRKAEIVKERIEGAPDLVVEILSPSTAYYDLKQKKNMYERYGVKEYVIIDPIEANAEVYRLTDQVFHLAEIINVEGNLVLEAIPGFSTPLKNLFQ